MLAHSFRWNDWNLTHIAKHSITPDEAEHVVANAHPPYPEQIQAEKWRVLGQSGTGRYLQVVFVYDPDETIYIIHARGLTDREKRRLRRRRR